MNRISRTVALALLVVVCGCADLKEVRDYSGQSAQLTAYPELTKRWASTYDRKKIYLFSETEQKQAAEEDALRKAAVKDLLEIHRTVSLYFQVLAKLAGDDTFSLDANFADFKDKIDSSTIAGIDERTAKAYTGVAKTVSSWVTSGLQTKEIRKYVEEGNAPIQAELAGMRNILRVYKGSLENEQQSAEILVMVDRRSPMGKVVGALADAEYGRISAENSAAKAKIETLDRALSEIAAGHQKLYDERDHLATRAIKSRITPISNNLKSLKAELHSL